MKQFSLNQEKVKRAWEVSQRSTKEDWEEWMKMFSIELLRESPSPSLRSCSQIAQVHSYCCIAVVKLSVMLFSCGQIVPQLARELFNAAFVSCWSKLKKSFQEQLVLSLESVFSADTVPPDILTMLLNLAEFMEHDEKPLPIDIRVLSACLVVGIVCLID